MAGEVAQLEVADREADDGRLVELAGDGGRQRQQLGQLVELVVLFAAARSRRVARFLLAQLQYAAEDTIDTLNTVLGYNKSSFTSPPRGGSQCNGENKRQHSTSGFTIVPEFTLLTITTTDSSKPSTNQLI